MITRETKRRTPTPQKAARGKKAPRSRGENGTPELDVERSTDVQSGDHVFTATEAKALVAFRQTGTVTGACRIAKIGRRSWYNWIAKDPAFAEAARDANEDVADDLEGEAVMRAKHSSDALLMFLLKARRPETYRDTQRLEIVSPKVRERLHRTIAVIRSGLPPDLGEQILKQLDEVWRG